MLLHAKLSFFAYIISGERSANRPKQLRNDAFHVKTSQSAKNQLDPAKNENRPKFDILPFCTKAFNYQLRAIAMSYRTTYKQSYKTILLELFANNKKLSASNYKFWFVECMAYSKLYQSQQIKTKPKPSCVAFNIQFKTALLIYSILLCSVVCIVLSFGVPCQTLLHVLSSLYCMDYFVFHSEVSIFQ